MSQKKKTKRIEVKYPGLRPEYNAKSRWELIDHDYIDKLNDEEKQWLSNFNEEYISGNFNHKGKKFHRTEESRRECYRRNNSRLRDLFNQGRTHGWMEGLNPETVDAAKITNPEITEDTLIQLIDIKDKLKGEKS